MTSPSRGRAWVWFTVIAAVILLPFVIAWPLGGLKDAAKGAPAPLRMGESVTGHRLHLSPRKAYFTTKDPAPGFSGGKDGRYVVLDIELTNVSAMPVELSAIYLDFQVKVDGHPLDSVMDLHDQQILRDDNDGGLINPKMTEKVRFSWVLPKGLKDPERLSAAMLDEEYQPSWSLLGYSSGTSLWYKQGVMATLETPLERA